MDTHHSEWLKH